MLRLSSVKQNFVSNMKNAEEALFMVSAWEKFSWIRSVYTEVNNDACYFRVIHVGLCKSQR